MHDLLPLKSERIQYTLRVLPTDNPSIKYIFQHLTEPTQPADCSLRHSSPRFTHVSYSFISRVHLTPQPQSQSAFDFHLDDIRRITTNLSQSTTWPTIKTSPSQSPHTCSPFHISLSLSRFNTFALLHFRSLALSLSPPPFPPPSSIPHLLVIPLIQDRPHRPSSFLPSVASKLLRLSSPPTTTSASTLMPRALVGPARR